MSLVELNRDPTPRQVRQFALLVLPVCCALAGAWCWYRYESWSAAASLGLAALVSLALGAWRPDAMRSAMIAWTCVWFPVGWIIAHTLMLVVYFLVITPIGLVMRAFGRDPLARRFDRGATTYWTPREPPREASSYFRRF